MKHDTKLACGASIKEMKNLINRLTFTQLHRAMSVDDDGDISERQLVYPNVLLNTFSIHCALIPIASEYRLEETEPHAAPALHPFGWVDSTQNLVLERDRKRHTPPRFISRHLSLVRQELLVLQIEDLLDDTNTAEEALEQQRLSLLTYAAHET